MKSKAQILMEQIDKVFEERGLNVKMNESKKESFFVWIPPQKNSSKKNQMKNQERK